MKKSNYQIIGILIILILTYLLPETSNQGFLFWLIVGLFFILGLMFILGVFPREKKKD